MNLQLKKLRTEKGFSQDEMANMLGIKTSRYGTLERGDRTMSFPQAIDCANILECSLDDLAGRDWPESPPMSADERELVGDYRRMADEDRAGFMATARGLAYAGDAKKAGAREPSRVDAGDVK